VSPSASPIFDPLARALLPLLLEQLGAATDDLDGAAGDPRRTLETLGDSGRAAGWVLGVLSSATGADMLLARREETGLTALLLLVQEALERRGRGLAGMGRPPLLAPGVGRGWELPWAIGSLLLVGAGSLGDGERLVHAWEHDGEEVRLVGGGRVDDELRACARRALELLPEARFEELEDAWVLALPAGWLPEARAAGAR
jgi:hypothetical protein